jgi:hypothetical protein
MTRTMLLRGLLLALAFYLVCAALARLLAAKVLFYPDMASRRLPAQGRTIRGPDGDIAVVHLPNPNGRFTIWFFHGNAEDLGDLAC